jgi:hypothetical protein
MVRIFTFFAAVFFSAGLIAQIPSTISYQMVIRNSNDQLVTEQEIGVKITIIQGSASGTEVYAETHSISTNINGLATMEIGAGTTSDDYSAIDWSNGPYFLKTEVDPAAAGGTNYTITGTSEFLNVPFALYASTAGRTLGSQTQMSHATLENSPNTFVSIGNLEFRYNSNVAGGFIEVRTKTGSEHMMIYCTKKRSSWDPGGSDVIENYHNSNGFSTTWSPLMPLWTGTDWSGTIPLGVYEEFEGIMFPMGSGGPSLTPLTYKFYATIDGYLSVFIKIDFNK